MNSTLIDDDERRLHGGRQDAAWERAPVDQEWWRAQRLPFPKPPIKGTDFLIPVSSLDEVVNAHQEFGVPLENFWMRAVLSPTWGIACFFRWRGEIWPAPGSEDTELGVFMGPEVRHGETTVYAGVQA